MKTILALALVAGLPAAACDCIGYCHCRPESKTVTLKAAAKICVPICAHFEVSCLYFGGFQVFNTAGTATLPTNSPNVGLSTSEIKWDGKSSHAKLSYQKGYGLPVQLTWAPGLTLKNILNPTQTMPFTLSNDLVDNRIPADNHEGIITFGGTLSIGARQAMGCYEEDVPITLSYVIPM